jgi:hypothetical protein
MKFTILPVLLISLLSGCAANYKYVPVSPEDPKITFGDRFGGGSIYSPARSFQLNTLGENKCSDYKPSGVLSNHWMGIGEKTREYFVPKDSQVALIGTYNLSTGSKISTCSVGPISFSPEHGKQYSIDVVSIFRACRISIVEILPDGKHSTKEIEQKRLGDCIEN